MILMYTVFQILCDSKLHYDIFKLGKIDLCETDLESYNISSQKLFICIQM